MTNGWVNSTWLMMTVARPSFKPMLTKNESSATASTSGGSITGRVSTLMASVARLGASDTRPMAAMVPTMAEMTPTLAPMIMLLKKAGQNCLWFTISSHQRSDRPSIGKLVSPRDVKEKIIRSTMGASRNTTRTMAMARQAAAENALISGTTRPSRG